MNHIPVFVAGTFLMLSTAAGAKAGMIVAETAAMPDWAKLLTGPFGALVGLALALVWLSRRLNRAEKRADERDAAYTEMVGKTTEVVAQNSEILRNVENAMERVADATKNCPGKSNE